MVVARHHRRTAEGTHGLGDRLGVGGDEDHVDRPGHGCRPVDVLDHGTAVDVRQRFAGKTRRAISGGDDSDDSSGTDGTCQFSGNNYGHGKW
jgi:hypothetical protein